jgi:thiamine biosynthesis lipoprotein
MQIQTLNSECVAEKKAHKRSMRLMGNQFEITVVAANEDFANYCIDKAVEEISRIERLLTTFNDNSQACLINQYAGIKPGRVDKEVYNLINRSIRISELTQGAFDISYGSLDKRFWNFDTHMTALPGKQAAKNAVRLINYRNIILDADAQTVFLKEKGMRIGFGGIGKGYAAERAKIILRQLGVTSGIVNASGDLTAWGTQPNGQPWTIGIADPNHREHPFSYLNITDMAIATSGSYEKFVIIDGKKYSHTIDPRTGFPVSGIKSVTVICPNAEIADAMATPITVMGIKPALHLINQIKDIACIIIDDEDRLYTSDNIKLT